MSIVSIVENFFIEKDDEKNKNSVERVEGKNNDGDNDNEDNCKKGDSPLSFQDHCEKYLSGDVVANFGEYNCVVGSDQRFQEPVYGFQRTIHIPSALSILIDDPNSDPASIKQLFISESLLNLNCYEEIDMVVAGQGDQKILCGTRRVFPALYYAVLKNNTQAVSIFLSLGADYCDVVQCQRLENTTHSIEDIRRYCNFDSIMEIQNNNSDTTENILPLRNEALLAAKLCIPDWDPDDECTWGAVGTAERREEAADRSGLTAFQLAFALQNLSIFEAFLQNESVQNMTGHLILSTKLSSWPESGGVWPAEFSRMQSIIELTVIDPLNNGQLPDCICQLSNLVILDIHQSGYTSIGNSIAQLVNLEEVNFCDMKVSKIPVDQMASCRKLTAVHCTGVKVASPPAEIISQGPAAVAQYIIGLGQGAEENHDVLLMMIGDGEAGKTSTLLSLKNTETNTAHAIGVDDRTIGIDISDFKPFHDRPLRFFAWDFGGQAVYAIMQQLFMSHRALYPLLWRVRESVDISTFTQSMMCDVCGSPLLVPKGEAQQPIYRVKDQGVCHAECASYESLITGWTERLQFRVPGVTVVLVATHIDCATPEQVDEQCEAVAKIAQRIMVRQEALGGEVEKLKIHNDGKSLRVNNVTGEGVAELRDQLRVVAEGLSFYGEVIPSSYAKLRQKLRVMQQRDSWRTWMVWPDYVALAKECGITDKESLSVATKFFHETGEMRYYGGHDEAEAAVEISEGMRVQGNYRGRGKYFPGVISRVRLNGTYDIEYDDGEKEARVRAEEIRAADKRPIGVVGAGQKVSSPGSSTAPPLNKGDNVKVNYKGKGGYCEAVITAVNSDGTYNVTYDAGDVESNVSRTMITMIEDRVESALTKGVRVLANYRNKGVWCEGTITAVKTNHTFKVTYKAGFIEEVPKSRIKVAEEGSGECIATEKKGEAYPTTIAPGLRVVVFHRGMWHNAEITAIFLDGRFEVSFDGGTQIIRREDWRFIGENLFQEGSRVTANYLSMGIKYPGTIIAVNADGTCDVGYDSKEKECGVKKEELETLDDSKSSSLQRLSVGDKVEARFRGGAKYYTGVITRENRDGTYSIAYDDGEKEISVIEDLIRSLAPVRPMTQTRKNGTVNSVTIAKNNADRQKMLLTSTVFPNPFWIVDVLRGLIRHDHSVVLNRINEDLSLSNNERRKLRRRVYRLMQRGLLHRTLLPYIWSGIAGLSTDTAQNEDEFRRLIALLGAFDILMERPGDAAGQEWVVPTLSAGKHARTVNSAAFVDDSLPFACRIIYDALPPQFDMMLIAHIMNSGSAQSVDFIDGAAAFHKFGDTALLFAGGSKVSDPENVFRVEQLEEFKDILRESQCHVVITSTSRRLMKCLEEELKVLEKFFPGLRRLATFFPCHSCRRKRLEAEDSKVKISHACSVKSLRQLSTSVSASIEEYIDAENKEKERVTELEIVNDHICVKNVDLNEDDLNSTSMRAITAMRDYKEFDDLMNLKNLKSFSKSLMRVYALEKGVPNKRYIQEVIYAIKRVEKVMDLPSSVSSDTFAAEIEETQCKLASCREEFLAQYAIKGADADVIAMRESSIDDWSLVAEIALLEEDALMMAFKVCPRLRAFGSVEFLQDSVVFGFSVGDRIEGRYRGRASWYSGVVVQVHPDGTYDIDYDDGERDKKLAFEYVRLQDQKRKRDVLWKEGAEVELDCRKEWKSAVITKVHSGRTVDVTTSDGVLYQDIQTSRLRFPTTIKITSVGQHVEYNFNNQGKWLHAIVHTIADTAITVKFLNGSLVTVQDATLFRHYTPRLSPVTLPLGGTSQFSKLPRKDLASVLLHALLKAVEMVSPHLDSCPRIVPSTDTSSEFDSEEFAQFRTKYEEQLQLLEQAHPDLVITSKTHFLVTAYGSRTPACMTEHARLLKSAVDLLETEPTTPDETQRLQEYDAKLSGTSAEAVIVLAKSKVDFDQITGAIIRSASRHLTTDTELKALEDMVKNLAQHVATAKQGNIYRVDIIRRKVESIMPKVQQILAEAKSKVDKILTPLHRFYEKICSSEGSAALEQLAIKMEAVANMQLKIHDLTKNLAHNRLGEVHADIKARVEGHLALKNLRAIHAPVWHFGGKSEGDRRRNRRQTPGTAEFLSAEDMLECVCEAEVDLTSGEAAKEVVVQPAEPCSVFISHSDKYRFVAKHIQTALKQDGVDVQCCTSTQRGSVGMDIIKTSKVVVICIDSNYATDANCKEEYQLAVDLGKEIIPILVADYNVTSYQQWWPETMPDLERHSLFVDLRSVRNEKDDEADVVDLCATVLVPTLKHALSEWSSPTEGFGEKQEGVVVRTAASDENGAQYVPCDSCALEGISKGGDSKGRFDRWAAKKQLQEWTKAELLRREQSINETPQGLCPVNAYCDHSTEKHSMLLTDLLACKEVKTTIPCPRCRSQGLLPPYCFEREGCLAELDYDRKGSVCCNRCHQQVPLFELLRSEVFISYSWGKQICPAEDCSPSYWQARILSSEAECSQCHKFYFNTPHKTFSTQKLVSELKWSIEEEAGVTCWHDLDRLRGGTDLVQEMEAGIRFAEVVIIFLNNAYVASENCCKEYLFATKHGKYVIPVLLPGYRGFVTSPAGELVPAEKWWPDNMTSLQQFSPIVLVKAEQQEGVLFELCERIQSRFHRAQRFATVNDAISYLRDYSSWNNVQKAFLLTDSDAAVSDGSAVEAADETALEARLDRVFKLIDENGDGYVDAEEMREYLSRMDHVLSREQVQELLGQADVNSDGHLSLAEFKGAVRYAMHQGVKEEE